MSTAPSLDPIAAIKVRCLIRQAAGVWQVLCTRSARCRVNSGLLLAATTYSRLPERRQ